MEYTDEAKEKTRNFPLEPYERKIEDEELGYMQRKKGATTSEN